VTGPITLSDVMSAGAKNEAQPRGLGMDPRTGLPVVGMVGVRVLAASPDDGAAVVAADVMVGDYLSLADLRAFAAGCHVVTFDHEHVPGAHVEALAADGVLVRPGAAALIHSQDKAVMRARLTALGVPCPSWGDLSEIDLVSFGAAVGWPLMLKAVRGGYDGKGVWVVSSPEEAAAIVASGTALLAEARVPIARELAAVVARSPYGQAAAWPVVETVQRDGICVEVLAPAPGLPPALAEEAQALALRIAGELGVVGVLAVELFETTSGELLVNELAMRPHNSGHWTIEGARTSQFEQHLRAVLDYPLGTTSPTAPAVAMANVLAGPDDVRPASIDERIHHCMARWPDVKIHLYGKGFRPGRKVGHVTALGADMAEVRKRAWSAADYLANGEAA
jgi:5-(carboxyamino)imidazole ribonucleotide synthase